MSLRCRRHVSLAGGVEAVNDRLPLRLRPPRFECVEESAFTKCTKARHIIACECHRVLAALEKCLKGVSTVEQCSSTSPARMTADAGSSNGERNSVTVR